MLQGIAYAELLICWIVWSLAFVQARKRAAGQKKAVRAPASRWGIALVMAGFALTGAYVRPAGFHKSVAALIASMVLGPPSVALVWAATPHLGKQWRYEAALSEDHELVRTGPYAWVRHPIYASMLGMLLATGFCTTWWPMMTAAVIVFVIGTEIRIHAEEQLLEERFQDSFTAYRTRVRGYIPFVR